MKKIIFFIITAFSLFADDRITGMIGVGALAGKDIYTGEEKLVPIPLIKFGYKNFSISEEGLGYSIPLKEKGTNLNLALTYGFNSLERGTWIDGNVILEDRDNPIGLKLSYNKLMKNLNLNLSYQKEFSSNGSIISAGISKTYMKRYKYTTLFIPNISYSFKDSKFSNYYYNLTKEEAIAWNRAARDSKGTSSISAGLVTNVIFRKNVGGILICNLNIIDKNKTDLIKNSTSYVIGTGVYYKF